MAVACGAVLRYMLYPPTGAPAAESMKVGTARPKMTAGRAALLTTLCHYVRLSHFEQAAVMTGASLLEIQKLMYFLQEPGQPLHLSYGKARYGPYAENGTECHHGDGGRALIFAMYG
jgi:hypothetical protein